VIDEPQIIRTPGGEELVVLSRKEYDSLIEALAEAEEELADIAVLDQRKAEFASSTVPNLPPEVSALLLKGHRRLAAIRIWRGLEPDALAGKAGIGLAELSDLEVGKSKPDPAIVTQLAEALECPVSWIEP